MTAGAIFDLKTVYSITDNTGTATKAIYSNLESIAGRIGSFKTSVSSIGNYITGALGTIGVALGFKEVKHGLIDYNAELEQTKIGMAAVYSANTGELFNESLNKTSALFDKFRSDAVSSVATTKDLIDIANSAMGPILGAGKTLEDVREITNLTVSAASALGVSFHEAGASLSMMLSGNAGQDNPLFRKLKDLIKMSTEEFNKLTGAERYNLLVKAMSSFGVAAEAYGKTWNGLLSTTIDIVQNLSGTLGLGIFNSLKSHLERVNSFLIEHKKKLIDYANILGAKLEGYITPLLSKVEKYIVSGVLNLEKIGGILEKAKTIAILLASLKLGSFVTGFWGIGGIFGGVVSSLIAIGAKAIYENIGNLRRQFYEAIENIKNAGQMLSDAFIVGSDKTTQSLGGLQKALGTTLVTVINEAAIAVKKFAIVVRNINEWLAEKTPFERSAIGSAVGGAVIPGIMTAVAGKLVGLPGVIVGGVYTLQKAIIDYYGGLIDSAHKKNMESIERFHNIVVKGKREVEEFKEKIKTEPDVEDLKALSEKTTKELKIESPTINNHFGNVIINQTYRSGDPRSVLIGLEKAIEELSRRSIESPFYITHGV